ncbi:hypothetical protein ACQUQP_09290 [Marinobacterium sp. YM272]|uniref:hypothetical protein n=1 Tax=Marinobacterium sp. YM272 TaxID=3421654 RepID=UPI003D7FA7B5
MLAFSLLAGVEERSANAAVSQQLAICDASSAPADLGMSPVSDEAVCPAAVSSLLPVLAYTPTLLPSQPGATRVEHARHIRAPPALL